MTDIDPRWSSPLLLAALVSASGCPQPEVEYSPAPAHLLEAWETPPMPTDVADPWARVVWTLNFDLREFDATWTWLLDEVEPGLDARTVHRDGHVGQVGKLFDQLVSLVQQNVGLHTG